MRPLPWVLATFFAVSALRSSASALEAPSPSTAMPMLARSHTRRSPTPNGSAKSARMRSALAMASAGEATSSRRTANSSPPKRAIASPERTQVRNRSANVISTSSPAA